MRFSIVVPAYNMERYIGDCLDSLVAQDYPKDLYEVVVVDDCTRDNQNEVIGRYVSRSREGGAYPSVSLISHKENKNLGGARNTGLRAARGEWVLFLDSDDFWLDGTVLSKLSALIDGLPAGVDVVRSYVCEGVPESACYGSTRGASEPQVSEVVSGIGLLGSAGHTGSFYIAWNSAYRREFLVGRDIMFVEHQLYEDSDWTVRMLHAASKVAVCDFRFVAYRYRDASASNAPKVKNFLDNIKSAALADAEIERLGLEGDALRMSRRRVKRSVLSYAMITRKYPVSQSRECIGALRRTSLLDTSKYELSVRERIVFGMLSHCPLVLISGVKALTLVKRSLLKCLKRSK